MNTIESQKARMPYLTQENADAALKGLKSIADQLDLTAIANEVLNNEDFVVWTGAAKPESHHYGKFGLLLHTYEVYLNGVMIMDVNQSRYGFDKLDLQEFFLSALFHDYGKIFDYKNTSYISGHGEYATWVDRWGSADHRRKIHHISRSALFFSEVAKKRGLPEDLIDRVLHNILSHHGCRAYGSPVSPNTRIAWILHLSDMVSARLYDCDTLDRF
jgi:3'-5' exoribonuclease